MNKRTRTALIVFGVLIVGGVLLGLAYSGYIPIEGAAFVACHTEGCALSADCYGANSSVTAVWGRVEGRLYVDGTQVATGGGNAGRTRKTYSMSASYDPSVPHTVKAEWRYYDTRGNRKPNYDCVREVTVQPCVQPTPTPTPRPPRLNISHVSCVDPNTGRVEIHFVLVQADDISCPGSVSYTMSSPCSSGGSAGGTGKSGGTCHYYDYVNCGDGYYEITGGSAGPYNLANPKGYNVTNCEPPPTNTPPPTATKTPPATPTGTPPPTPTNTPPPTPTNTPSPTPTGTLPPTPTNTPPPTGTPRRPDTPTPTPRDTPTPTPTNTPGPTPTPTPTNTPGPTPTPRPTNTPGPTPTPTETPPPGCPECPTCGLPCPACPSMPVFHTDEDENWDLARLPLQGEEDDPVVNLTRRSGRDIGPSLSADGWWIVFQSERDGNWEIYTMDFNGQHQTRQTYDSASDTDPVWSPVCVDDVMNCGTGTVAFQSDRTGNWDIFLLDAGSTAAPFQVTTDEGSDTDPYWAPTGSQLTFQSDRNGSWDIFVVNADGSQEAQITDDENDERDPIWSPDGSSIAYTSNRNGDWDLYSFDVVNRTEAQLTSGEGDDLLASWSPSGRWIAFQSDRNGNWDIYAYDVISDVLVQLTDDPADDEAPAWECDGTRVMFHSVRDGNDEIYSVALADATDVVRLTDQDTEERYALWTPISEDGSLELEMEEEPEVPEPEPEVAETDWLLLVVGAILIALVFFGIGWIFGRRGKRGSSEETTF
jgi:Tol biopolymer transport system component